MAGQLGRRGFLALAGSGAMLTPWLADAALEPWRTRPGAPPSAYGAPSPFAGLQRENPEGHPFGPAAGVSGTPLQALQGIITPNSLHFERHHSGIPEIDPARHQLVVHGAVDRALQFSREALERYPMISRTWFLECSGNTYLNSVGQAPDLTAGELSGLFSCAEWTGVPLSVLLDETGTDPAAGWLIAEGADSSGNNRSIPMSLARERGMVALYQNGEPVRPDQGYPMRLFMAGCEGNISIKWLRSLKVADAPAQTREETSKYTDLMADGRARSFSLVMEVKSLITSPSGKMQLQGRGVYPVTGLAWSGEAPITQVEVSDDGGGSWSRAELQTEPGPFRPVRFALPWRWDGTPAVLQSRATDAAGNRQPTHAEAIAGAPLAFYHYNAIQSWAVDADGRVRNVHA